MCAYLNLRPGGKSTRALASTRELFALCLSTESCITRHAGPSTLDPSERLPFASAYFVFHKSQNSFTVAGACPP